ncbi:hypothetical protein L1987_37819 [Smallanthus sonchifolius]|uniref:Uncharacterized protein n=1 Tax=Smallanthus sonchifolius TaxID=185202 RepID=A0ACB9HJ83_9ASTR|nr:hypothetical protein L1987_37819 [Smallanthus sonchifolius]
MFSQPTTGCDHDEVEQQEIYVSESEELLRRVEAQGMVINDLYANFLRESSYCKTDLNIELENENGSESHPVPSFDVFEQESEAEKIMNETQVPPPVQSGFEYDEPEFPCPRVLTNKELESGKCFTTRSIGYEYDTHVPLFAYGTMHDSLYLLCTLHLSCEDDMMQGSQREEHRKDELMNETEVVLLIITNGETTYHTVPSWEDEFGDEFVSISLTEGKGERFDPFGYPDELEALLYGKPTMVTKEEPHQRKK